MNCERRPDGFGSPPFLLRPDYGGATPEEAVSQMKKEKLNGSIEVPHPSYQPNAKELREDLRLKGTFEDGVKALLRPVRVRKVMPKLAK